MSSVDHDADPTSVHTVLALPLRREILDVLREGPAPVGTLVERIGAPQAAVSKQLRVLREAGFVAVRAEGRRRWYALRPEPFAQIADWLEPYRWLWEDRLDRLGERLERMQDEDLQDEDRQDEETP
jgi:DNA-binding transcriptional ArsR family regulator